MEKYTDEDLEGTVPFSEIELKQEFIPVYGDNGFYEKDKVYLKIRTFPKLGNGNCLSWDDYTVYKLEDNYRVIAL